MSTATAFGIDIPVWDYMTGHEWEQVEIILADPPQSAFRADLEILKVFVESRTEHTLDVDEALDGAVPGDEVGAAVEALTAPFAEARRKRALRELRTQAHLLSTPKLTEQRDGLKATLDAIERLLSERDGSDSKASSSTTTQGGGSKGGKRGRSKKRSN